MKSLKAIFRVLICISLICVISAAELLYCAHSTLMSTSHFSRILDNEKKLSQLTMLVYSSLTPSADPEDKQSGIRMYALNILNKSDQAWVRSQIYIVSTGLHKYLTSEAATLPTLDFVPLKIIIRQTLLSELMKQPQVKARIENVKTVLTVLNNKYFSTVIKFGLSNQLVTMLLELAPIQNTGFDRTAILEIIRIHLSFSNKGLTLDQASYNIVEQIAVKTLELDKMKDYFDINLFLEKAFGEENPALNFKTMVSRVDTSASLAIKVLFWCLMLLVLIDLQFSLIKLLRALLYCIAIASIFNILLSAILVNPYSSQWLITMTAVQPDSFSTFLVSLWRFLLRDFGLYLALQSVLISIIASVCYVLIRLILKKRSQAKKQLLRFSMGRYAAILVIIIVSFSWWTFHSISIDIRNYRESVLKLRDMDISQSIAKGFIEAGGMNFLEHLQKK